MKTDKLKEELRRAAFECTRAETEYLKLKERFDELYATLLSQNETLEQPSTRVAPAFHTLVSEAANQPEPLTLRVQKAMPQDGTPIHLRQLAALVGGTNRVVSATCSNLRREGLVESKGRGYWCLKK